MFSGVAEMPWLWGGLSFMAAGTSVTIYSAWERKRHERLLLMLMTLGVAAFGVAIAERWLRTGYGPFATMFDILLSNLFSLGLVYVLAYWRIPRLRPAAPVALLIFIMMGLWIIVVPQRASALPAVFQSYWFWIHLASGKVFLGVSLVAASIAGLLLYRLGAPWRRRAAIDADVVADLDLTAWRFVAVGFVADGIMLIAGAVWAQDAWGRYWGWDPLESWSLLTWLVAGFALHLRVTSRTRPWIGWWLIIVLFVIAFLTLFGLPFISTAPHRGVF